MIAGLEHNSIILTPNLLMENVGLLQSPNVYKSCPKMNSLEKWIILTPLQKLHYNVGDLGKIIVATSFECLPKVQKLPNLVTLAFYYLFYETWREAYRPIISMLWIRSSRVLMVIKLESLRLEIWSQ